MNDPTITGQLDSLKADELAVFSSITFLLNGLNSNQSKIEVLADKLRFEIVTPKGPVAADADQVAFKADMSENLFTNLSSEKINLDFKLKIFARLNRTWRVESANVYQMMI